MWASGCSLPMGTASGTSFAEAFLSQIAQLPPVEWDFDNIVPFDSSETKRCYLLRGKNNEFQIKLSPGACSLVVGVHSGLTFAELAQRLNQGREGTLVSEDEVRRKYEAVLGQLADISERRKLQKLPWGFWARIILIPKPVVARIAGILSHLYRPVGVVCSFLLMAAALVTALHIKFSIAFGSESLVSALGPFLILAIAHEFGHASACYFFGERPSSIGFAFYLVYPAFYSDVSSAWGLRRKQRVAVDLGGCYFQGIVTAIFLFVFYWTGWEPLRLIVVFSLYAALTSLNPVFKFDGYWMLADLLGVSNLANQRKRVAQHLLDRIRGRAPKQLPWPASITRILVIYSAVAQVVWILFAWRLLPMVVEQLNAGARALAAFGFPIVSGKLPTWSQTGSVLASIFSCLIFIVMLWNIALMVVGPLWRSIVTWREAHRSQAMQQGPKSVPL